MGHREIRRVPATWQHPKRASGSYQPLFSGLSAAQARWDEENEQWSKGFYKGGMQNEWIAKSPDMTYPFEEWDGKRPEAADYMPEWPAEEATYLQLYECTSEGTPVSPPMMTAEALAQWAVDNNVSFFADIVGTFDEWLGFIRGQVKKLDGK